MSGWRIIAGDCRDRLRELPAESIDAVVCDPPYGIGFMGHEWDQPGVEARRGPGAYVQPPAPGRTAGRSNGSMEAGKYDLRPTANRQFQAWCESWARECLRVLKPGGHLLSFGGTRTYHRMVVGIEDAGFEIRDQLAWMFGSGFPKSLDVSKAIDKAAGAERDVVGPRVRVDGKAPGVISGGKHGSYGDFGDLPTAVTTPATEDAQRWDGWGTALKPAFEPIVMARKPLAGTVAANVLEHGTGALNIDDCRIGTGEGSAREGEATAEARYPQNGATSFTLTPGPRGGDAKGRWPANVVLDQDAAEMLDEQSGELVSGANPTRRGTDKFRGIYGDFTGQEDCVAHRGVDVGGASRFFYCAKTSRAERNAGLGPEFVGRPSGKFEDDAYEWATDGKGNPRGPKTVARNPHPTVKPIDLMRWLCRLVTPPGGALLDPFTGSGSTGCAAVLEGFDFIGIEREPEYVAIAAARIGFWAEHGEAALELMYAAERSKRSVEERKDAGQLDLLGDAA